MNPASARPLRVATLAFLAGLILAAAAAPVLAVAVAVPLTTVIHDSDIIVVGQLTTFHEIHPPWYLPWQKSERNRAFFEGTIRVERVLWPQGEKVSAVPFEWGLRALPESGAPYQMWMNRPFLWILQRRPDGKFACNPQGALPMDSPGLVAGLPRLLGEKREDTPAVRAVRVYLAALAPSGRLQPRRGTERPVSGKSAGSLPGPNEYVHVDELPEAIIKVPPEYPGSPRQVKLEATVIVKALVGKDGLVKDTVVAKSVPLFDEAAMACVRKWTFRPARANGAPVAAWIAVPVHFNYD